MNKKFKFVFIVVFIILLVMLFFCMKDIYLTLNANNEVKTLSTIDKYGYTLNENDSPYFKSLFLELKTCLESDEVDSEEYAKLLSELFVVDFYSLDYSLSKSDVGGVQFVYSEYQSSFISKAKDTIYSYVESNIYGKRKQELPDVKNVSISNIEQKEYNGKTEKDDKAYYVDLKIEYDKDLGYPEEVSLILIHKNDKLQVVKMD